MKLLLDTHALLWFLGGSEELSNRALHRITAPEAEVHASMASLWEIAIKVTLGKLKLPGEFEELFPRSLEDSGLRLLSIELSHLDALRTLPFHHRDPFDRLLIAQARAEGMELVSNDSRFPAYEVPVIW